MGGGGLVQQERSRPSMILKGAWIISASAASGPEPIPRPSRGAVAADSVARPAGPIYSGALGGKGNESMRRMVGPLYDGRKKSASVKGRPCNYYSPWMVGKGGGQRPHKTAAKNLAEMGMKRLAENTYQERPLQVQRVGRWSSGWVEFGRENRGDFVNPPGAGRIVSAKAPILPRPFPGSRFDGRPATKGRRERDSFVTPGGHVRKGTTRPLKRKA